MVKLLRQIFFVVVLAGLSLPAVSAYAWFITDFAVPEPKPEPIISKPSPQNRTVNASGFKSYSYIKDLPLGDSPVKGPINAPVTITVFSDFQCPYCARLSPTLDKVFAAYPNDVRIVFKNFPLNMHKHAKRAAYASMAAAKQGKFWPMHDRLFGNYNKLDDNKINEIARDVGLDIRKFERDSRSRAVTDAVDSDLKLGAKIGVRGVPSVHVNGEELKDRSYSGISTAIKDALKGERKLFSSVSVESDVPGAHWYLDKHTVGLTPSLLNDVPAGSYTVKVIKSGYENYEKPIEVKTQQNTHVSAKLILKTPKSLPVGVSPSKGPIDAPITLTAFLGFQCPYSARMRSVLDQLVNEYPKDVRLVIKNFPLKMHKYAKDAAVASLAADKQGKYWSLYGLLFDNYKFLDDNKVESLAREAGLDMRRFNNDLNNAKLLQAVDADTTLGIEAGVRGTPSVFINGVQASDRNLAGLRTAINQKLIK